jgi:hypothetical protein
LPCLGFIPNACATHYNGEPQCRASLHATVESGEVNEAIAIDDRAAVVFTGTAIERVVSWQEGSTAYRVFLESGRAKEVACSCESISNETG